MVHSENSSKEGLADPQFAKTREMADWRGFTLNVI
jgi:hypothetical protein